MSKELVEAIASVLDPYIDPAVCGQTRPVYIRDAVLEVLSNIEREGFKVVPVTPTIDMLEEGFIFCEGPTNIDASENCRKAYAAMLSVAPKQA